MFGIHSPTSPTAEIALDMKTYISLLVLVQIVCFSLLAFWWGGGYEGQISAVKSQAFIVDRFSVHATGKGRIEQRNHFIL